MQGSIPRLSVLILTVGLLIASTIAMSVSAQEPCLEVEGVYPYGPVRAVAQDGQRVFYGSGRALMVAEITAPSTVTHLGELTLDGLITDTVLDGDLAYVAHSLGLAVVDLSDPLDPVLLGQVATPMGGKVDLEVYGSHAYAISDWGPIRIFDCGDPANPVETGSSGTIGMAESIEVDGERLYSLDRGELTVFGLSVPSNPDELGRADLPSGGYDFDVAGTRAYVISGNSLHFIEVGWPDWIYEIGTPAQLGGGLWDIEIHGSLAAIPASSANGAEMLLVDLNGNVLGNVQMTALPLSISFDSANLWFYDPVTGLHLTDISDPAAPVGLTAIEMPGSTYRVAAAGGHAYAVSHRTCYFGTPLEDTFSVDAFSVVDPTAPLLIDELDIDDYLIPDDILIENGLAYFSGRFSIVDVSVPDQLQLLGGHTWHMDGGLTKLGSVVYWAPWDPYIYQIDVSDPTNLGSVGMGPVLPSNQDAIDIAVADGRFCIVSKNDDDTAGLFVVADLSDPLAPVIEGSVVLPEAPEQVVVDGDHAYVRSMYGWNILVVDIADHAAPQIVATVPWGHWDGDIVVSGDVLYSVASPSWPGGDLLAIDIRDPSLPQILCELDTLSGHKTKLSVSRGELFAADGDAGFSIYRQYGGAIMLDGFETGTTENWIGDGGPAR